MANVLINKTASIDSGGGAVYPDVKFKGDNTNTYVKGQLCYVSGGTLVPRATAAGVMDTDTEFASAKAWAIVLEDYATKTAEEINCQMVTKDTIFVAEVVDASASDVTMDTTDIGTLCEGYQDASGNWGVNNATTKGALYITDVDARYEPFFDSTLGKDSGGTRHSRVKFKINPSLVIEL